MKKNKRSRMTIMQLQAICSEHRVYKRFLRPVPIHACGHHRLQYICMIKIFLFKRIVDMWKEKTLIGRYDRLTQSRLVLRCAGVSPPHAIFKTIFIYFFFSQNLNVLNFSIRIQTCYLKNNNNSKISFSKELFGMSRL